jgi:hypothetical protein
MESRPQSRLRDLVVALDGQARQILRPGTAEEVCRAASKSRRPRAAELVCFIASFRLRARRRFESLRLERRADNRAREPQMHGRRVCRKRS